MSALKVIYIAGVGRSGSTLLDTVLGNHERIVGVGELNKLTRLGLKGRESCACGQPVEECAQWRSVIEQWQARVGGWDLAQYVQLQDAIEPVNSSGVRLPHPPSSQWERYERETRSLFEAIGAVTGKQVIVDSSKSTARALALARIDGLEVYLLHLVRDVRGVVASLKSLVKKEESVGLRRDIEPLSVGKATAHWCKRNVEVERAAKRFPPGRSVLVRYEDFVTRPAAVLAQIGSLIGEDLGPLGDRLQAGESMTTGHTVAGNRLRFQASVRLNPDGRWVNKLSSSERLLIVGSSAWLMHHYGYQLRSPETRVLAQANA